VVRRMVRRAVRFGGELGIHENFCARLSGSVVDIFADIYPELAQNRQRIAAALDQEEVKFKRTLERGLHQYTKLTERLRQRGDTIISGAQAFDLFETYGFPLPLTAELAKEDGFNVDEAGFDLEYQEHKRLSRQQAEQSKFKGGLADHAEATTRLHTATHLLQQALRQVLGTGVQQMGSNITVERLRFDFTYPARLTPEQLAEVERIVNAQIERDLPVAMQVMPLNQALENGALAFFGEKYGEQVKVYSVGDFSKEVCGGPHVPRTGGMGHFKITKEEAVGQGVRRIRAVLE
jgi:alanyl-tRNA synthetase